MKSYIEPLINFIEQSAPMNESETRIWYKATLLRKEEEIHQREVELFKYRLTAFNQEYYTNSLFVLFWYVIRKRLW
jgi:hypothetical protein